MQKGRRLLGAASVGGNIFVFGGNCGDEEGWYSDAVEVYDVHADTWTELNSLPVTGPASAATVGEFIYVFIHGNGVYRYSPSTDSYVKLNTLPLKNWFSFDVTCYGSTIFLHGGAVDGASHAASAFYTYDTRSNDFTEMPKMLRERRRTAACVVSLV